MSVQRIAADEALARLAGFDTVIDARSESEFALDRLPGAVNWPSLRDDERARVGTLYVQVNPFEARKLGAALVARNIAAHIERACMDKPKGWQPLLYCWRGGQRSGALALVPFLLKGVADGPDPTRLFQADRIHPTAAAHPIILGNVWPTLQKLLK